MDNSQVYRVLKNFSFTEQEVDVYLAVLKLGRASVTQIAAKMGVGRTACYFHVKNLVERGFLKQIKSQGKYIFVAEKPDELAVNLENNLSSLKLLLPDLEALTRLDQETPSIEVKESLPALLKIYDEIAHLPNSSEFRVIEGKTAMKHEIAVLKNERMLKFFEAIKKNKILTRALFTKEALEIAQQDLRGDEKESIRSRSWSVGLIDEEIMPFKELAYIYGSKVAFVFPETSTVVFIKHQRIAQAMKAMFDALHAFAHKNLQPWN